MVGRQSLDVAAVAAQAHMSIGPDDKKRYPADTQPVGGGWGKPCVGILIVGAGRQRNGRFDQKRAASGSRGALESCEAFTRRR